MSSEKRAESMRNRVRQMLADGHTPRAIAMELGVTTQAVYLQMEALRKAAEKRASA